MNGRKRSAHGDGAGESDAPGRDRARGQLFVGRGADGEPGRAGPSALGPRGARRPSANGDSAPSKSVNWPHRSHSNAASQPVLVRARVWPQLGQAIGSDRAALLCCGTANVPISIHCRRLEGRPCVSFGTPNRSRRCVARPVAAARLRDLLRSRGGLTTRQRALIIVALQLARVP